MTFLAGDGVGKMAMNPRELSCFAKSFSPNSHSGYHCFRDGSNENYTTLETWLFSFKSHQTASANKDKGLVVKRWLDPDTWVPTQQLYLLSCWVTLGWLLNCSEPHYPHQKRGSYSGGGRGRGDGVKEDQALHLRKLTWPSETELTEKCFHRAFCAT